MSFIVFLCCYKKRYTRHCISFFFHTMKSFHNTKDVFGPLIWYEMSCVFNPTHHLAYWYGFSPHFVSHMRTVHCFLPINILSPYRRVHAFFFLFDVLVLSFTLSTDVSSKTLTPWSQISSFFHLRSLLTSYCWIPFVASTRHP